jgi:hypothetical protein
MKRSLCLALFVVGLNMALSTHAHACLKLFEELPVYCSGKNGCQSDYSRFQCVFDDCAGGSSCPSNHGLCCDTPWETDGLAGTCQPSGNNCGPDGAKIHPKSSVELADDSPIVVPVKASPPPGKDNGNRIVEVRYLPDLCRHNYGELETFEKFSSGV